MEHRKRNNNFKLIDNRIPFDQEGAILIGLIITFTLVMLMGAALFSVTITSTYNELFSGHQSRAHHLAESGGRYAIPRILQDHVQAETDLHNKTFILNNGDKFLLLIDNISSAGVTYLESEGIVGEGGWLESKIRITFKIPRPFSFKYGAFSGTGRLTLKNNAYVDSYDSTIAPWSAATRRQNGTIATNRIGNKSIDLQGRTVVYGNGFVGVGGNPATHIDVAPNAIITGTRSALTTAENMTPPVMPAGGGVPYNLVLDNNDTQTLSGGPHRLSSLEISDNAVLTITGDVTLYVIGVLRVEGRGEILIQTGGSLTIYAADQMLIRDDARLNVTGNPGDFILFGTSTFNTLQFAHRSISNLAVYAPSANTRLTVEASLFGSVIAGTVTLEDDVKLHYDEALGRRGGGSGGAIIQYL